MTISRLVVVLNSFNLVILRKSVMCVVLTCISVRGRAPHVLLLFGFLVAKKKKKKPTAVAERGARVCIAPCHCVVLVRWQASCWPAGMSSRGVRAVYFRACLCSYLVSLYRPEAGHRHYAN